MDVYGCTKDNNSYIQYNSYELHSRCEKFYTTLTSFLWLQKMENKIIMTLLSSHLLLKSFPDYELLDSGDGMKFERYGTFTIARPESQALWSRHSTDWNWDAFFDKSGGGQGKWMKIPSDVRDWIMSY